MIASISRFLFFILIFVESLAFGGAEASRKESLQNFCEIYKIKSCQCQNIDIISKKGGRSNLCEILDTDASIDHKTLYMLRHHGSPDTAVKYCKYFNISYVNCSCNDMLVRHQSGIFESCKTAPVTKPPKLSNIYDLCKLFNISRANCSCDLFTGFDFDVCEHFKNPKVVTVLYTHDYQIIYATIATITAFLGILGNLQVIFVSQLRSRRVTSNFNWLIKLLAIYDLTFAVLQVVVVIPKLWTTTWLYDEFFCRLFNSVDYLSTLLAAGVILMISVERYLKLFHPLYELIRRKLNIALAIHVIISFAAVIPLFVYSKLVNRFHTCRVVWNRSSDAEVYNIIIFAAFFVLPISVVIILYGRIIRHFMLSTIQLRDVNHEAVNQRNLDNKRVIKSMVSVVVVFILFVFPRHIVTIYLDSKGWNGDFISASNLSIHSFYILMYIAHIPYIFHVCANPFIYSITDSRWRQDFKEFLYKIKNVGINEPITMTTFTTMNMMSVGKKEENNEEGFLIIEDTKSKSKIK